jgi:type I restriction enzyme R subunit
LNYDDLLALLPPDKRARVPIDQMLDASGWAVQGAGRANLTSAGGMTIRGFILEPPHGRVDYLIYVDGKAARTIEAKPEGYTLTSAEPQTTLYIGGMRSNFPAPADQLHFSYKSCGSQTRSRGRLNPDPRSRLVFSFHSPETLAGWLDDDWKRSPKRATPRARLQQMPPPEVGLLWPPKHIAIGYRPPTARQGSL